MCEGWGHQLSIQKSGQGRGSWLRSSPGPLSRQTRRGQQYDVSRGEGRQGREAASDSGLSEKGVGGMAQWEQVDTEVREARDGSASCFTWPWGRAGSGGCMVLWLHQAEL